MPNKFQIPNTNKELVIPSVEESYNEGYSTGQVWVMDWKPSGPFVTDTPYNKEDWRSQYYDLLRENRKQWLKGFADGVDNQKG